MARPANRVRRCLAVAVVVYLTWQVRTGSLAAFARETHTLDFAWHEGRAVLAKVSALLGGEKSTLSDAWREVDALAAQVRARRLVPALGKRSARLIGTVVRNADTVGVSAAEVEKVFDAALQVLFQQQLLTLEMRALDRYEQELMKRPNPLLAGFVAEKVFVDGAQEALRPGSNWSYAVEHRDVVRALSANQERDIRSIALLGKSGQGKHVTAQSIRKLQQQAEVVSRQVESRGAFPWDVTWQYINSRNPIGFRGQYSGGRSVVEVLLMPSPDPKQKKSLLNRLGPLNLAVVFDMFM